MKIKPELKACHCGGVAEIHIDGYEYPSHLDYMATCTRCSMNSGWHPSPEKAAAVWNNREDVPAVRDRIRELELEIRRLRRELALWEPEEDFCEEDFCEKE